MAPVLLVHCSGSTSRQWRKLGERLALHHRVIAPDLIGHGAEQWPDGKPFHFREDVTLLSSQLDEPAHVVGHSYGGLLALQLALARPEAVRSLAIFEPIAFGVLDQPGDAAALAELGQLPEPGAVSAEIWLEQTVDWWQGAGAWAALPPATRQAYLHTVWKTAQEAESAAADRTGSARYATVTAPTLILMGEHTRAVVHRVVQRLAQILSRATLQRYTGMGHMGPITHAERVNPDIERFIASIDATTAPRTT